MVETIERLSDVLLKILFPEQRIGRLDSALGIHAYTVVISERVVNLQAQFLLRPVVQIEEAKRTCFRNGKRVEYVVAALYRKVCLHGRACA